MSADEKNNSDKNAQQHLQQFALICHYDFWEKTGKQSASDDVPEYLRESLAALKEPTLQLELSEVISMLIERLEVSEFTMPTVGNTVVDASPLKMHVPPRKNIFW